MTSSGAVRGEIDSLPAAPAYVSLPRVLLRILTVPLVAIIAFSAVMVWQVDKLLNEEQLVDHADAVITQANEALRLLVDMETGVRGYLLTGREDFLAPYTHALPLVDMYLADLRSLVTDSPTQLQRVDAIHRRAMDWIALVQGQLQHGPRLRADVETARDMEAKRQMDSLRAQFSSFTAAEQSLRVSRVQASQGAARRVTRLGLLVTLVLAGLFSYTGWRQLRQVTGIYEDALYTAAAQQRHVERARQQAEAANQAKDQFLATVSHELRTPLSPILSWAHMLLNNQLDAEQTTRALQIIQRNAQSQAHLIEDLLDISRIVSGKLRLEIRPVALPTVIQRAVDAVQHAAEAKDVQLHTSVDADAGMVAGDPDRLQQAVWNLLTNAVKFTPRGGRVQVRLTRIESQAEIAVSDTGPGIPADFLPHVFERFQQLDQTTTRTHGGLGLGLSITRHIIELHGGSVHADSAGEGRGAVFCLRLPLAPARVAGDGTRRTGAEAQTDVAARLRGIGILLVDDDPDSNDVVRAILASCGAEVRTAVSAAQALEIMERWRPAVLISDIGMPEQDGYALIAAVRARAATLGPIIAIALTAYASQSDRVRLLSAGFQMHLAKPIDPQELIAAVASLARA